jgi:hypothetical protein
MADMTYEEVLEMYAKSLGYRRYNLPWSFYNSLSDLYNAAVKYAWKNNRNEDLLVTIMRNVYFLEKSVAPFFTGKNYEFIREQIDEHYEEMDKKFGLSIEKVLEMWRSDE